LAPEVNRAGPKPPNRTFSRRFRELRVRRQVVASFILVFATAGLSGCDDIRWEKTGSGWTRDAVKQLEDAVAARATHGLDRVVFQVNAKLGSADGDAALSRAALAYADALAHGVVDPAKVYDVYTVPRPRADLRVGLQQALASGRLAEWLQGLAPQDANYRKLSKSYLALRQKPAAPAPAIPPPAEPIEPGVVDPRVPAIAAQLAKYDYLPEPVPGDRYVPAMVAAMRAMQADYGLKPDGVIGPDAAAILNLSDEERARAIAVNLERLRWLERNPPATRIDVNLAAARLSYWRDGKLVNVRKVVVGKPDHETPQLGSPIFRLVANPTWTVPRSIQEKEIAPKGPGYLTANNMTWQDGWIVQGSGPKNSLGLVKFDMENDRAIYLHDTPAKALFALTQRQRSHGCVRVEDAPGFAAMIAADEGVEDQWQEAQASGKETFVRLKRKIPVRMLYQTILFDESGDPIVRSDPYQWNDRIAAKLGFAPVTTYRLKSDQEDFGP